jgi:hypothetical protein
MSPDARAVVFFVIGAVVFLNIALYYAVASPAGPGP